MPGRHHQQRVTIRIAFRNLRRAQRAAGTWPVFDHHALPHAGTEPLAHNARHDVGRAAGGEGHDDPDNFVRIVRPGPAGRRLRPAGGKCQRSGCKNNKAFHVCLLNLV